MPKIRGVKPDYWTDEDIVDLTIPARLLFIGLWSYACDNGHLQDKPKQIKMRIFPGDDVSAADLLRELEAGDRIIRADGWIIIPNFTKHQRPDKRYFQTCEKVGCERPPADSKPGTRGGHDESTTRPRRAPHVASMGPHVDGDGEGDGEGEMKKPSRASRSETDPEFDRFWATYNKPVGKKVARSRWATALKKPGVTADLLIASAASYVAWQRSEGKHPTYTKDPATWLNGEHWNDERAARQQPQTRVQSHMALVQQLAAEEAAQPTIPFPQIGQSR